MKKIMNMKPIGVILLTLVLFGLMMSPITIVSLNNGAAYNEVEAQRDSLLNANDSIQGILNDCIRAYNELTEVTDG